MINNMASKVLLHFSAEAITKNYIMKKVISCKGKNRKKMERRVLTRLLIHNKMKGKSTIIYARKIVSAVYNKLSVVRFFC